MHIFINKKYLTYGNLKAKCALGKKGIGIKKKEGDLITPKGLFKIKKVFYRRDRLKYLDTKLSKNVITNKMGWCDDSKSKKYNQLIKYPFSFRSEKLYRKDNIYDIILILDFNMKPILKKRGSAIFLHVAKKDFSPTKGCIAISKINLKRLVGKINKRTKIKII